MLTFESKPEGATIYEGKTVLGIAPVTRTYIFTGNAGTIETPEVTAVWPSGAKATYWTNLPVKADLVATIERPANAPGLDKDMANAQTFIDAKNRDAEREKKSLAHVIAHVSARCKAQQHSGNVATSDCYYILTTGVGSFKSSRAFPLPALGRGTFPESASLHGRLVRRAIGFNVSGLRRHELDALLDDPSASSR